jgi:hypothetical protein
MYLSTFQNGLHYGLNKFYSMEEIEKQKQSPSSEENMIFNTWVFDREHISY